MRSLIGIIATCLLCTSAWAQQTIVRVQYWWDQNLPDATLISTTAQETYTFEQSLETQSLATGLHLFNYRAQSSNGAWSVVQSHFVYKNKPDYMATEQIVRHQHWFNTNWNDRQTIESKSDEWSASLNVEALPLGLNILQYRAQQSNGQWSTVHSYFFMRNKASAIYPLINAYEYWFDDRYADRVFNALENPASPYEMVSELQTPLLPKGEHQLHIRFRNTNGAWTVTQTNSFMVNECSLPQTGKPMGNTLACTNDDTSMYSINKIPKATAYQWHISPTGAARLQANDTLVKLDWDSNFMGNAKLWATASNVCGVGQASDSLVLIRAVAPEQPILGIGSDTVLCSGDSLVLTAPISRKYVWQDGSSQQHMVAKTTGDYKLTILNDIGCRAMSSVYHITVAPKPYTPSIMAYGDTDICLGDSVELGPNNLPKAAYEPEWNTGSSAHSIWVKQTGSFAYRMSSDKGCKGGYSDTIKVTVHEPPQVPTITQKENVLYCTPKASSYKWFEDKSPLAGLIEILHATGAPYNQDSLIITNSQAFVVSVSNSFGCTSYSHPYTGAITSVFAPEQRLQAKLFPNPCNGQLYIQLTDYQNDVQAEVWDTKGIRLIGQKLSAGNNVLLLGGQPGQYFVKLISKTNVSIHKLMVE